MWLQADGRERRQHRRRLETWFLPMRNPKKEHANPDLRTYMQWHNLEQAPVSYAARQYVERLESAGIECDLWRDWSSRPLLYTAAQWNYVSLVKWLLSKGCSLAADDVGQRMLYLAERENYTVLRKFLAQRLAAMRVQLEHERDPERNASAEADAEVAKVDLEED